MLIVPVAQDVMASEGSCVAGDGSKCGCSPSGLGAFRRQALRACVTPQAVILSTPALCEFAHVGVSPAKP